MYKSIVTLLLNAALVSSVALTSRDSANPATPHSGKGPVTDSADAILVFTTCNEVNLGNCLTWTDNVLPVTCTSLAANGQGDLVQSAATPAGIECTLFANANCSGASQLIDGTVDDLSTVGFADKANGFTCQSN